MVKIKRALVSVSDKKDIVEFAKILKDFDVKIISTGGTKKLLDKKSVLTDSVFEYTQTSEMLEGRVKTLHPKIHAGILALRDNEKHIRELKEEEIDMIDMVVVNLYPFKEIIRKKDIDLKEAIENIDIGGSALLRAAAKNFKSVAAVCSIDQYSLIMQELKENDGKLSEETLSQLAVSAFEYTSNYDRYVYEYLRSSVRPLTDGAGIAGDDFSFSQNLELSFKKIQDLRYGENPHQKAAFYRDDKMTEPSLCYAKQLHGKELSFNNIMDLDTALEIVKEFKEPTACIVKHSNPCGVASSSNITEAYQKALETDALSAFGGIVGLNTIVDEETAGLIVESGFIECLIACGYTEKALNLLKEKKNLRILDIPDINQRGLDIDMKKVTGGLLLQEKDIVRVDNYNLKVVTQKKPTQKEIKSLLFAEKVCRHVKSNAIVLAKDFQTVGIGAGQMSRVDSVIIAVKKAGVRAEGSLMASDAFFPKEDSIKAARKAGVKAIIQPGGSIKDKLIIEEANKARIAMVFTGIRHFRH